MRSPHVSPELHDLDNFDVEVIGNYQLLCTFLNFDPVLAGGYTQSSMGFKASKHPCFPFLQSHLMLIDLSYIFPSVAFVSMSSSYPSPHRDDAQV